MAQNWSYDDDDPDYDPATYKFGSDEHVAAYAKPDRAQELVDSGHVVTANAIQVACHTGNERTLEVLLAAKPDPNVRLAGADSLNTGVESGWAMSDITPNLGIDMREWYPLQLAATGPLLYYYGGKSSSDAVQNVLLQRKPNLFAIFKQPIWRSDPFPFPGEDESGIADDWSDNGSEESVDYQNSLDMVEGMWREKPKPEYGYGLRSVLHSMFEDGAYLKPVLEHRGLELDLEQRDPQGRTLLHSACRNAVGADAVTSAMIQDTRGEGAHKKDLRAPEGSGTSIFHTLRLRGADVTSVDFNGKNVLHHLLEARAPLIRNTLKYVLKHEPQLIDNPDHHGTYPLHTALQRLRGHLSHRVWLENSIFGPIVHDILDAGADATARDSRGNTAIHYLADNGLAEQCQMGARVLCQRICDAGADVNARNNRGRRALEILMDDNGEMLKAVWEQNTSATQETPPEPLEKIDAEVFAMLDKAGAHWTEQNLQGQTLLHLVAKYPTRKTKFRVQYLLDRGVDPGVKDHDGRLAIDIARESDNKVVIETLERTNQPVSTDSKGLSLWVTLLIGGILGLYYSYLS